MWISKYVKQFEKCADKIVESEGVRECYYSQGKIAKVQLISKTLRNLRHKQMIKQMIFNLF